MGFIRQYVDAGYPCIYVRSTEQERVLESIISELNDAYGKKGPTVYVWKITEGLHPYLTDDPESDQVAMDLVESLKYIKSGDTDSNAFENRIYIFFNPKKFLTENPVALQALRDAAFAIRLCGSHIVFIGGGISLPEELEDVVTVTDFDLPNKEELKTLFKGITDNYKDLITTPVTEELLDSAVENASGLTRLKAENAVSMSIVESKGIDVNILRKEKQAAIKQSGVLEYIHNDETIDTLGGFDLLKEHVSKRARFFSDHKRAIAFGLRPPKGIMLAGNPGCLDSGTKLRIRRGKRVESREYTVEEAYNSFNGISHPESKGWNRKLPVFTQSLCDDIIRFHEIDDIVCSGVKERFEVVTDMGRKICVTSKHPFKVPDCTPGADSEGYIPLHDLKPGDMVICQGTWKDDVTYGGRQVRSRRVQHSIPFHPHGSRHFIAGKDYKRLNYARLVVEASNNGLTPDEFIQIIKEDEAKARTLSYLPSELAVHHIDGDVSNDSLENLMVIPKGEHERLHGLEGAAGRVNRGMQPVADHIKSIKSIGYAQTYDIVMKAPYHNYVADGFVVHNTGKTLASKAIAASLNLPLYRFNLGAVFGSLVGQSEQRIREATKLMDAIAPAVILVDEAEKLMAGLESSGKSDSGTTSRVLGAFMSWMNDTKSAIYKVATVNSIRNLDGSMMRKGRWDEIFAVGLPSSLERVQIFAIHLKKINRDASSYDLEKLSSLSDGFVGAEIAEAVSSALFNAFSLDRELQMSDLEGAITSTVPISITDKEGFREFQAWMKGRATPVSSSPEVPILPTAAKKAGRAIRAN